MRYPPAERQEVVEHLHGRPVHDPYRWLEDPESPSTLSWLAAQDELFSGHAATLVGRERLRGRGAELADTGSITAPMWRGDRRFTLRRAAGQEHAALCTAQGEEPERVLIDPTELDPTGLTTLDAWQPDLEGRLLAYQVSTGGTEQSRLYVLDVETGQVIDGPIDRCRYSPVTWLAGGKAFFYVRQVAQTGPARRVYLHTVGDSASGDVSVFGSDRDEVASLGLGISHDGRWLAISSSPGTAPRNDLWLADLSTGDPARPDLRPVQEGLDARSVLVVGRDERLYVVTDLKAPRVRLCVSDPTEPSAPENWHDLVPEDPAAVLSDFTILDGPELARPVMLVTWIRHAIGEISVHDLATGERLGEVPLPGAGSVGPLSARSDGGHEAWFTYTDTVTPGVVWHYDARTGETSLWAAAPGSVTVPEVETTQISCTTPDGSPVRVTVIGRAWDGGPRPTLLYGYGGFGVTLTPSYAADALTWVEAGGVLAIAHLRGGGEEGLDWHRAGMLKHKQNVFDDFLAAAEKLISDGWTTPDRLGIWGESNGGLLVGAALTQRPDLFAAAVCSAPLLDMVRYEKFGLGASWRGEYGTAEDPEQFRWLLAYSPYHHVRTGVDYPATLFTVFGGDSRVDPLHARKMCAAMQAATAGDRPILLRHQVDVGHGPMAASLSLELAADMLAFIAAHTGLTTPKGAQNRPTQTL